VSDFLVNNLGFFFVPAGVGLMLCLDILADSWLPIVVSVVVSTILIIFVTGHVHQWVRNYLARNNSNKDGISGK
jgi:holin-like protein